jgi:hypothetical protein
MYVLRKSTAIAAYCLFLHEKARRADRFHAGKRQSAPLPFTLVTVDSPELASELKMSKK